MVLSLCDRTGNAVRPWAAAGYRCLIVDIQHEPGERELEPNIVAIGANVLRWVPPTTTDIDFVFAFPPCTDMAVSGARWFAGKGLDALADALHIVAACARIAEASGARYIIENPRSTLATYWRKPDYEFDPYEYAGYLVQPDCEAYTKRTCLWTGGGFVMPQKRPVQPTLGSIMHRMPPAADRADWRSVTPKGFAQAIFDANCRLMESNDDASSWTDLQIR
jgi:hypothetical protein